MQENELLRELLLPIAQQLGVPLWCNGVVVGGIPFFQQVRMRNAKDAFSDMEGIHYIRSSGVIAGPFRVANELVKDEELKLASESLPQFQEWHEMVVRYAASFALPAAKTCAQMQEELERVKLLRDFSAEVGHAKSVERALSDTSHFLLQKFKVSNVVLSAFGKEHELFSLRQPAKEVLRRILPQVRDAKVCVIIRDVQGDFSLKGIEQLSEVPKVCVVFPMIHERSLIGVAAIFSEVEPNLDKLSEVMQALLAILVRLVQYEEVKVTARTDQLTGLANRAEVADKVGKMMAQLSAQELPFSVVLADVDNFKKFNDTYGHPEGDKLLKSVATALKKSAPQGSLCARYGGEEFLLVLPNSKAQEAKDVAEKFRLEVKNTCASTISVGVMTCLNSSASWEQLVKEADRALYRAKHLGKDKVVGFVMVDKNLGVIE